MTSSSSSFSSSSLTLKKSVNDIWPVKNKKFLVRLDLNVPIKNGTISNDLRIRAALPTVERIVRNGGSAILMSHLGRPTGVRYDSLQRDESSRQYFLETWFEEHGTGCTMYFSTFSGTDKKKILSWSSLAQKAEALSDEPNSGKTLLFSQLSREEKKDLLNRIIKEHRHPDSDHHHHHFPHLSEEFQLEQSLKPVAKRVEELLRAFDPNCPPVLFAEDCMNADHYAHDLQPGQVLVLENLRFYKEEGSKKDEERLVMARKLASYGDYFVSDAFGTAHRNSATMTCLPHVMGHGAAGYLMAQEISAFFKILKNPPRPYCAIVGGAKVSDKILLLENLMTKIDKLIIGGAMAYTFLKAKGLEIGRSFSQIGQTFTDQTGQEIGIVLYAKRLLDLAEAKGIDVCLPVDHVCHTACEPTESPIITSDANVPVDYMALDIGPATIELYTRKIRECKAAIWNGPMGVFEIDTYATGTFAIATIMGEETEKNGMLTIVGGGDSASAAEKSGQASRMSHVSTGGGASLELLEGKELPGILALDDA